ncbi:hypothetical protein TRVL_09845 [Trypanosoma vivax]|nr:hypothetical protein TRVL_09845 [Trypanosoma vivax]
MPGAHTKNVQAQVLRLVSDNTRPSSITVCEVTCPVSRLRNPNCSVAVRHRLPLSRLVCVAREKCCKSCVAMHGRRDPIGSVLCIRWSWHPLAAEVLRYDGALVARLKRWPCCTRVAAIEDSYSSGTTLLTQLARLFIARLCVQFVARVVSTLHVFCVVPANVPL